jgi:hypothetical protein
MKCQILSVMGGIMRNFSLGGVIGLVVGLLLSAGVIGAQGRYYDNGPYSFEQQQLDLMREQNDIMQQRNFNQQDQYSDRYRMVKQLIQPCGI